MPEPRNQDRQAAADAGFLGRWTGFASAAAAYLKARLQLAGLEAKDAAVHYAILVALLIAALIFVVFGYLFLWLVIVFGIAALIGGPYAWIWVTLGVALLHFGLAVAALFVAKNRFATPQFTATINEFNKDQQWLNTSTAKPR